ncbi:hypothetical protein SE92_09335 [Bradyrhizobium sp. AT1]|nr:hypothetical protein SE92_09335 [Bradyrhizobium sp. AT1]
MLLPACPAPPFRRPCTSEEAPAVKSIRVRSVCASAVGSRVATLEPETTNGPLKLPPDVIVLIVPSKLTKVGRSMVISDDIRLLGARLRLTTSLPKPKSTAPLIFEPGSSVSVSAALDNLIALPSVPVIVPELVMVAVSSARMPIGPTIDPVLTIVVWRPSIAKPFAAKDAIFPSFVTVTVRPLTPPRSAWISPVLFRLTMSASIARLLLASPTICPAFEPVSALTDITLPFGSI